MSKTFTGLSALDIAAGEAFERDFIGECEVVVKREGHSRARHTFTINGRSIARLRWRGLRQARYEADGMRYYITIGALQKRITIATDEGAESFLLERSRANPHREGQRVEMAEGDNFCLTRSWDSRLRSEVSLAVHKEHYKSTLMVFRFDNTRRTQTTVRVEISSTMRREARFVHRLLALVVCRIILERRHSGAQPLRIKEHPSRFASSARVRDRKRP
ncbi:MAG TPA: hypothetical protein VFV34_21395 [Blastocatellia bacterium]|nr:hypothetical protein [Blastocatellia bacterium]